MRKILYVLSLLMVCCILAGYPGEIVAKAVSETLLPGTVRGLSGSGLPSMETDGVLSMLREDDVCLELVITREYTDGSTGFYLHLDTQGEGFYWRIKDITLNGRIRLPDIDIFSSDSIVKLDMDSLFARGILRSEEELQFSCHVQKIDINTEQVIREEACKAEIPAGYQPVFVFLPCLGAYARKQTLINNSRIRVTLLDLGRTAGNDSKSLSFLLKAENLSGEQINLRVTHITINGMTFSVTDMDGRTLLYELAPGLICYPYGHLSSGALRENSITTISDVSLHIQVKSARFDLLPDDTGSLLYPVELSEYSQGTTGAEEIYRNGSSQ